MDGWWWVVVALTSHLGPTDDDRWARVLTGLDLARAQAFAAADTDRLDDVYVSPAAAADDADSIKAFAARGARVQGAVLRIERLSVVRATRRQVVLDVTDRLGPAKVRWRDGRIDRLPADAATRREIVLVLTDDGWRISRSRIS